MTYLQAFELIRDCADQLIKRNGKMSSKNQRELCREIERARRVLDLGAMASREI